MQRIIPIFLITVVAASQSFAKGSIGDWQTVQQDIPRGWGIEVVTSMTFPCEFDRATENELICMPIQRGRRESDDAEIHVRRDRIREIRAEKREGANMLAGGGTGAGLGAILGAMLIPGGAGRAAFVFCLGGASIGGRHGRETHILRGKVIYRRPIQGQDSTTESAAASARKHFDGTDAPQKQSNNFAWVSIVQTLP